MVFPPIIRFLESSASLSNLNPKLSAGWTVKPWMTCWLLDKNQRGQTFHRRIPCNEGANTFYTVPMESIATFYAMDTTVTRRLT
ncbi:hypothetical protein V6N13_131784 [Hibiscus sabdariffa]